MVGGEFAYFGISAEISGIVKALPSGEKIFETVTYLELEKDGDSQVFEF